MISRPDQRVAVFIDTQNMYHSAKHLYNARVNFAALVDAAVAGRRVVRAIAYVAKSKTGEEQAFFEALSQSGIELKVKDVQEFASGEKKADWDVGMAVDAMAIASRVDSVILVTGDGDFLPLLRYLQSHGTLCEVVAFGASTNNALRESADSFLDLSDNQETFLIHARGTRRPSHAHARDTSSETNGLDLDFPPSPRKDTRPSRPRLGGMKSSGPSDIGPRRIRVTY